MSVMLGGSLAADRVLWLILDSCAVRIEFHSFEALVGSSPSSF